MRPELPQNFLKVVIEYYMLDDISHPFVAAGSLSKLQRNLKLETSQFILDLVNMFFERQLKQQNDDVYCLYEEGKANSDVIQTCYEI